MDNCTEIERKFQLKTLPNLPINNIYYIEQGYVSTNPEVRIRSKHGGGRTPHYTLCIKSEGTLSRQEIETEITRHQFEQLRALCGGPLMRKIYVVYRLQPYILECSIVDPGEPHSFIYAEIEFPSMEEAESFTISDHLWRDVTDDPHFKMKSIWERSRGVNEICGSNK